MRKNKRGLSGVVETLIIILITVVAIGMIWVIIRNIAVKGVSNTGNSIKCGDNLVDISSASCDAGVCSLSLDRTSGKEVLYGVRVVISAESSSSNFVKVIQGDIPFLTNKRINDIQTGMSTVDRVEIEVMLQDESGQPIDCPVSASQDLN